MTAREKLGALLAAAAVCAMSPASTWAQSYPAKPVQLVVPAAPGGSTDLFARKFAERLDKQLGASVVVVSKGGGSGTIGTGDVARAAPDGYTLLMGTTGNVVINPLTMKLNFDPVKDLSPIAVLGFVSFAINVNKDLGVDSVEEFVRLVKASPEKYSYVTNGPAGFIHMITELFSKQAGLQMVAVPYPGGSAMQQDLITGRVQVYFDAFNSALRFHRSGQTRLLATTGSERSPVAPEIPTVSEAGMPGYVAETAFMLMAPAGIPAEVRKRLVEATRTVMADKALWEELEGMGVRAVTESDPEAANAYIRAEFDKWTPVVKSLQKGG